MTTPELVNNYAQLLLAKTPLLDVRAPVEFVQGAFPGAVNLPLMDDAERQAVGITYKEQGQDAAVALGHQLVSGQIRQARIAAWVQFMQQHPDAVVYCFRGGMRSQIAQQWLSEAGFARPRIEGGYKAMRQFLLQNLTDTVNQSQFVVVGGLTGSGKTDVIVDLDGKLDLEALARHRGSSFGGRAQRQPSQIDFENNLSIDLLRLTQEKRSSIAVEDESHLIGRCAVPLALRQATQLAPMIWVTAPLNERVNRIQRDYVESLAADYITTYGQEDGMQQYQAHLTKSLHNLHKRLGLERYAQLQKYLEAALAQQVSQNSFAGHQRWIEPLLTDYYDPMYKYQRQQKQSPLIFEGTVTEVIDYLRSQGH